MIRKRCILPGIVCFLLSCQAADKWAEVKQTGAAYPADSIYAYTFVLYPISERRWINASYKNYEYKKYCKSGIEAAFDITEPMVSDYLSKDSMAVAKMLQADFKKTGVAHFVAQTLSEKQLRVYLYIEEGLNPIGTLFDFKIPNKGTIRNDANWSFYSSLLQKQ